ncbi:NDP-hexose 2,3-dehydratase family protein [Parabacteroides goldsteinii]|jgi:NDP-hexose 2,3-dehydratase|uniref:NDP-hexose 2,3-dehydratase family protein n=1 Tax=Parabacteroides goldsteinii TaxID=328812 RepID=UPI002673B6F7|nr:NDP-hexose 2,3-dehydratase family protein [Parabacteroides goldsteinii]
MNETKVSQLNFLISALHPGAVITTEAVLNWMKEKNSLVISNISELPLDELKGWSFTKDRIAHTSGKFFSIDGIRVKTNYGLVNEWEQPIINQPEIGFLGFIVKKINGVLHFLLQAKIEPGNLNIVQLSPTLQATRSNYMRVHNGITPKYLDYFTGEKKVKILVDQLQSEQGARFLQKRNRNIIVEVGENEDLPVYDEFIWLTLRQIKELLGYPNVINMDTRTVISCIQFGSYREIDLKLLEVFQSYSGIHLDNKYSFLMSVLNEENHLHDLQYIISWITALKFKYELQIGKVPLEGISDWVFENGIIHHIQNKYFSVIGVSVQIGNREVTSWNQPMIKSAQDGLMGFLVKKINGIYHFLVQAKLEAGNFDIVEMAPTVQCLTGNYRKGKNEYEIPYLDLFLNAEQENIWYSTYQSEEGGRFYHEQNLNMIVEVHDDFPVDVHENYCWMTLNQMLSFVTYNNYLNMAARSLISVINFR